MCRISSSIKLIIINSDCKTTILLDKIAFKIPINRKGRGEPMTTSKLTGRTRYSSKINLNITNSKYKMTSN